MEIIQRPMNWRLLATNLANEGVPIMAIARAIGIPSDEVREALKEAVARADLIAVPREDWPIGVERENRHPQLFHIPFADKDLIPQLMRIYHITGAQAQMLAILLRRAYVSKDILHQSIQRAGRDETMPKIVDVLIHRIRSNLKEHKIYINTIWGKGYYMDSNSRKIVFEELGIPASAGPAAAAVALATASSGGAVKQPG